MEATESNLKKIFIGIHKRNRMLFAFRDYSEAGIMYGIPLKKLLDTPSDQATAWDVVLVSGYKEEFEFTKLGNLLYAES